MVPSISVSSPHSGAYIFRLHGRRLNNILSRRVHNHKCSTLLEDQLETGSFHQEVYEYYDRDNPKLQMKSHKPGANTSSSVDCEMQVHPHCVSFALSTQLRNLLLGFSFQWPSFFFFFTFWCKVLFILHEDNDYKHHVHNRQTWHVSEEKIRVLSFGVNNCSTRNSRVRVIQ